MKQVAAVAVIKGNTILLGKRRDNGRWTNPGGHIEEGEKPLDGAVRELYEEAGIRVGSDRLQPGKSRIVETKNGKIKVYPYILRLRNKLSTTIKEDPDAEVHRWHWIPKEDIVKDEMWDNMHVPPSDNVLFEALSIKRDMEKKAFPMLKKVTCIAEHMAKRGKLDPHDLNQLKTINELTVGKQKRREYAKSWIKRILRGINKQASAIEKVAVKKKEYAPGIREKGRIDEIRKVVKPENWVLVLQKHDAVRRGTHYDFRLGDPNKKIGHSWVLPEELPEPGKYIDVPRTETHSLDYFKFKGTIPKGTYGAGKVKPVMLKDIEVYRAHPKRISFILPKGNVNHRFTIVGDPEKKDTPWRLINHTPTTEKTKLSQEKIKVKETREAKLGKGYTVTPKLSGAHGIIDIPKAHGQINLFSYRKSKRTPDIPIDHTFKLKDYYKLRAKPGLGGTRLRGEIVAVDNKGKLLSDQLLGPILNSGLEKGREKLEKLNARLMTYVYNIEKYKGGKVLDRSPEEKERLLKEVVKQLPGRIFKYVAPIKNEKKQRQVLEAIRRKKHPLTEEGIVIRNEKDGKLYKYKFRPDVDVYVRGVFQEVSKDGKKKDQAGGFYYSYTPRGKIVGKVGTGFDHKLKKDMWNNKDKYINRVAKVTSQDKTLKSGALYQPSFTGEWHIEKGE